MKILRSALGLVVIAALILGVFFRVTHIDRKLYWHDEVFTSLQVSGYISHEVDTEVFTGELLTKDDLLRFQVLTPERGWGQTWKAQGTDPHHPPFYYLLVRLSMEWFGSHIWATRVVAVMFSLLIFPALFWLYRELFEIPQAAWVGMALFAVSPFHILYAQEAREYSLWTLGIILSSAALLRAMRLQKFGAWALYAATVALNLYTFLFAVLVLMSQGLFVLLSRPFSLKTLRSFLLSILAAIVAFIPWIIVLYQNWWYLESKTGWTQTQPTLSLLISLWGLHLGSTFVDPGFPLEHPYTYIVPPLIAVLLGWALWTLWRTAPRQSWLLIITLIAVPSLALMLPDLLMGGQRSSQTRYFTPALLGAQLAMTYLLTYLIWHPTVRRQRWGQGLLAILLTVGIVSSSISWQAQTWWTKSVSYSNVTIANTLSQVDRPVVMTNQGSGIALGNIISLSYLVKDDTQFRLFKDDNVTTPLEPGNYYLYFPSEGLIKSFQQMGYATKEVYSDGVPLLQLSKP